MYRKTGETSIGAGVYHSECRCKAEITVRKGEVFPQCPRCRRDIGWMFTRSTRADLPAPPGVPAKKDDPPPRPPE